ncbi:MAG: PatB family C-S lyase [Bacteroidota bacterium]
MKIDKNLKKLPLTKSNPNSLESLFGKRDITPMWVADMEFEIAKPIQEALIGRISNSGFAYEYKPESFFKAQKEWYINHYQLNLVKEHILYSPSITTTIAVIIENNTERGDSIITQPPVFMEFRDVIRKTNRRITKNSLKLEGTQYKIDFEDLRIKSKEEKNKILILCNPHNPVGRVWTETELKEIVLICKENDIILISDEIHKDIVLFDNKFTSVLSFKNEYDKIVVVTSEAKTFNLPGISDSMVIIPDEDIRNSVKNTFNRFNLGRTNALTRVAFEAAYKKGDLWLQSLIEIIEDNVNIIDQELSEKNSRIKLIKPEGTYQVWLDFRNIFDNTKEMFKYITENSGVAMNAGHWFGREGALFMRMNIATNKEKVQNSIQKIIKAEQLFKK